MSALVEYVFTVKGCYPNGTKTVVTGTLSAPDGFPFEAFDAAVGLCQKLTPDLIVDQTRPSQVILRKKRNERRKT